jgi:uncharacterized protein YxjI
MGYKDVFEDHFFIYPRREREIFEVMGAFFYLAHYCA